MPEIDVTITVNDDGTVDLNKFADNEHLAKVKAVIDGLRSENAGQRTRAKELEAQVAELDTLKAQVDDLEGKATMTEEEKKQLQELQAKVEKFGDLDPDKAREALDFQTRTLQERQLAEAFEVAGLNAKAALKLDGVRNLETRVQSETVDGKPVKTAQVKVGDDWKPLSEHVESEYSDFLPVLKPTTDEGKPTGTNPVPPVRGRPGKGEPKSLADAINQHYDQ